MVVLKFVNPLTVVNCFQFSTYFFQQTLLARMSETGYLGTKCKIIGYNGLTGEFDTTCQCQNVHPFCLFFFNLAGLQYLLVSIVSLVSIVLNSHTSLQGHLYKGLFRILYIYSSRISIHSRGVSVVVDVFASLSFTLPWC